jgi:DNA-binding SARP family transcriptional activator
MTMSFRVLGPLRAEGEKRAQLTAGLPRRVLALFLLSANRLVTTERIREELWSDRPPRSAASNLSSYLTLVRRAAHPHLESQPSGCRISLAASQLDLQRFRDGVAVARRAMAAGDLEWAAREFRDANGLWSGSALEGIGAGPVLGPLVHALDEEHWAAVEDQFDVALMLGRHQPTLPALVANANAHPSRERSWAQLMVALYRSGRAVDALHAYARMQRWLASEFEVTPSPLLQQLRHRIWAGDPTLCSGGWRSDAAEHRAHHARGGVVAHAPRVGAARRVVPDQQQVPGRH